MRTSRRGEAYLEKRAAGEVGVHASARAGAGSVAGASTSPSVVAGVTVEDVKARVRRAREKTDRRKVREEGEEGRKGGGG